MSHNFTFRKQDLERLIQFFEPFFDLEKNICFMIFCRDSHLEASKLKFEFWPQIKEKKNVKFWFWEKIYNQCVCLVDIATLLSQV